jgi:hypothetical protein
MSGFDRFAKRWAGGGQVAPITDNNANLGLAFLGAEPPTVEIHNQIWQWNDEKDNWLFEAIRLAALAAGAPAPTETTPGVLATAIRTAASQVFAGIQRNATLQEAAALSSSTLTITPATLKPLLDALTLGVATSVPAGAVMAFSRSAAPSGWLVADGSSVSRSQYLNLFNAIGTMYGAADNNSFTLPDMRGMFVRGWANSATGTDANRVLGSKQGSANLNHGHGLTLAAIPAHSHTGTTDAAGQHAHPISISAEGQHTHGLTMGDAGFHNHVINIGAVGQHIHAANTDAQGYHGHTGQTYAAGEHTHAFARDASGGANLLTLGVFDTDRADEGYSADASIIQTAGNHAHAVDVYGNGTHAHNVGIGGAGEHSHAASSDGAGQHSHSLNMIGAGLHVHTLTMSQAGQHTHTFTTAQAGGVQPTGSIAITGDSEARPINIALLYCIKV